MGLFKRKINECPAESKPSSIKTYHWIHRKWPRVSRRATWYLMLFELAGLVPCLVIFGIAQPNLYRTDMWEIGWQNKWNSNPAIVLYAYANHRPQPKLPLIWSRTLTDFNVAISVMSLFFLMSKLTANIMKVWVPLLATFINVAFVCLYGVSTYGQIGPDYLDERYPAPAAWYFRYGCNPAKRWGKYKSCKIAQGSLVATLYMLVVYALNLGFALYAMWPNKVNDLPDDDEEEEGSTVSEPKEGGVWEMHNMKGPASPRVVPYTPRTQAFHTLDRKLPLRSNHSGW